MPNGTDNKHPANTEIIDQSPSTNTEITDFLIKWNNAESDLNHNNPPFYQTRCPEFHSEGIQIMSTRIFVYIVNGFIKNMLIKWLIKRYPSTEQISTTTSKYRKS